MLKGWDYESGMMNYDYRTPQNVVDSLTKYQSLLFRPLQPDRYFTDGSQRDRFLGAFQPRVGASYAVTESGSTTVFGGWGIYYDRNLYDLAAEEAFSLQHPKYTIFFSDPAGPAVPGQVRWEPRFLTEGKAALDAILAGVGNEDVGHIRRTFPFVEGRISGDKGFEKPVPGRKLL